MAVDQIGANDPSLQAEQLIRTSQAQQAQQLQDAAQQKPAEPVQTENDAYKVTLSAESLKMAQQEAQKPEELIKQGNMV